MIEKRVLPNGLRIVAEELPHVRSASMGIWVKNGSRHEPDKLSGISHLIEHMVFKGTASRTTEQIAIESDSLGGQIDAFTDKECTCFTFKVLDTQIRQGIDLLSDMVLRPAFPESELELERNVVLEEIDMYEDSPEDVAIERLFEQCYQGSALGKPILGTRETLFDINSERLSEYHSSHYGAKDIVVAISGHFTSADLDYIAQCFSQVPDVPQNTETPAKYRPAIVTCKKEIEQNHLCLSFEAPNALSPKRYTLSLLSGILGLGMSSRLFQAIREKNGLCYTIYSFTNTMLDTGVFSIYTSLGRKTEKQALSLLVTLLEELCEDGVSQDELNRCRSQIETGILMGLESTETRMMRLGKSELMRGTIPSMEQTLAAYENVTKEQIKALANEMFLFEEVSFSCVGTPFSEEEYLNILKRNNKNN